MLNYNDLPMMTPDHPGIMSKYSFSMSNNIFYVDPIYGDDTNDGLSSNNPLKTLKLAFDKIPIGSNGKIVLLNDLDLTGVSTEQEIFVDNKRIWLEHKNITVDWIYENTEIGYYGHTNLRFVLQNNSGLYFYSFSDTEDITIKILDFDTSKSQTSWNDFFIAGMYSRNAAVNTVTISHASHNHTTLILDLGASTNFYISKKWDMTPSFGVLNVGNISAAAIKILANTDAKFIDLKQLNSCVFNFPNCFSNNIYDYNGNQLTLQDIVSGIIYDADNKPRNLVSNIIF